MVLIKMNFVLELSECLLFSDQMWNLAVKTRSSYVAVYRKKSLV